MEPTLGKIQRIMGKLTLKPNTTPVYVKARPMPFKLKSAVEEELKEGVIEKVNTSDWATPIAPVLKKNGSVRICGDFKVTLNPHLEETITHFLPPRNYLLLWLAVQNFQR